jgi:hypothetical protein
MHTLRRHLNGALTVGALLAAALGSACGVDGVELNGAVFDYLGVSEAAQSKSRETKVAERPGIVLPPQLDRLPEPGSAPAPTPAMDQVSWPNDPDERTVAAAADLDRQHEEFCREALWKARAQSGNSLPQVQGPKGLCNPSILKAWTGKDVTTRPQ